MADQLNYQEHLLASSQTTIADIYISHMALFKSFTVWFDMGRTGSQNVVQISERNVSFSVSHFQLWLHPEPGLPTPTPSTKKAQLAEDYFAGNTALFLQQEQYSAAVDNWFC